MITVVLPLPMPAVPLYTQQQNVKFVTVTRGLYYCDNMNESGGREKRMERREEGVAVPTKLRHGK